MRRHEDGLQGSYTRADLSAPPVLSVLSGFSFAA